MRTSARSSVLALAVGIGALSACAGSGTSPASPAASPSTATAPSAATSPSGVASESPLAPSPAASAAASSGARTCVSSSDGPEIECKLEAGTYRTVGMRPNFTYTVPSAGWSSLNREVAPGNFHLFPPGGSMAGFDAGATDDITIVTAVVPPGTCTGEPSTDRDRTFDGMVEFLTTSEHVAVSNRRDASAGGWKGTVMDIRFVAGDGCPDGVYADLMIGVNPAHGAFGITPGMAGAKLFLLRNPTSDLPLAVIVDDAKGGSDYGDGAAWYDAAQSVIDTLVFAP